MNNNPLHLFLLSDIHFRRFSQAALDIDRQIRQELIIDARSQAAKLGNVHGVIVCGDVAFSGDPSEYNVARRFLIELCSGINCPAENVWVIPGNHDVDRSKIENSRMIRLLHSSLRDTKADDIDYELSGVVKDEQARQTLLSPLEEYNIFASGYGGGCAIDPEKFYWEHDLPLNDGSVLRLRGINSTLISDEHDDNQSQKLLVGDMQTGILREEGVAYMTLCHHPVEWLIDGEALTDALNANVSIQLYGHKHRQRITPIGNHSVIISAGAVQPTRGEGSWNPTYNIASLLVKKDKERHLTVELRSRLWNDGRRRFYGEAAEDETQVHRAAVILPDWNGESIHSVLDSAADTAHPVPGVQEKSNPTDLQTNGSENNAQVVQMANPERRLMFRFFSLPYHQIVRIGSYLDLIADEDRGVQESEQHQKYFRRAKERGQLAPLWELVEKEYGEGLEQPNPFALPAVVI